MRITSLAEALAVHRAMDPAHFTGHAAARDLIQASPQGPSIVAAVVRFDPGARNHWHSHAGGQVLHVIEGEGWVQVRGQAPQRIRQEDTVIADPGEEHWHGAGSTGPMAHLAFTIGETRWLEESEAPPS